MEGFTVVELVVVMVIMAILLTLGVASYNSYQVNVRDSERLADINAIATGLEARYDKGNSSITLNAPYSTVAATQASMRSYTLKAQTSRDSLLIQTQWVFIPK